jgi:glyoxylase-like metal-dependent hydrolase (beta-lactamase superfamily II)
VRLEVLETPGHTPEAICILVYDKQHDPLHPHAVLTGDTLFIGDVGRPDLMASGVCPGVSRTSRRTLPNSRASPCLNGVKA